MIFAFPSVDSDSCNDSVAMSNDEHDQVLLDALDEGTSSSSAKTCMEQDPSHNTKIHRLSPTHLMLTSGLAGDSRTLASAFRRLIASWTHIQYGETISVRELAKEVGMVRHGIGLRPGARVLGVVGVIIGLEDVYHDDETKVEVRMYKSLPGGTIDRCNICCTGGGADSLGRSARKETMEALSRVLSLSTSDSSNDALDGKDQEIYDSSSTSIRDSELERIIEEVAKASLKHHPFSNKDEASLKDITTNKEIKMAAVDIWMAKAVADPEETKREGSTGSQSCEEPEFKYKMLANTSSEPAFVSPHRRLGKASLNLRYARRVNCDQLPAAIQSLVRKNP